MKLNELRPAKGATKKRKRVGRGQGSGTGHTAGKGEKGQKSRSGGSPHTWFEGGQMPLIRRVPKVGFHSRNRVEHQVINVSELNRFEANTEVTLEVLLASRLVRKKNLPVKILGNGEIDRALKITVDAASATAISKVEAAGGSLNVLAKAKK